MPAPSDLNDRIAKAKGWTNTGKLLPLPEQCNYYSEWLDPTGRVDFCPDFTGTLEGVAGMMRELNEKARHDQQYWWWGQNILRLVDAPYGAFICVRHGLDALFLVPWFWSPDDRPGDCVGEALLSVLGKKTAAKEVKGVCDKGEGGVP